MSILSVVFVGLILLVMFCVVRDVRKKFTQAPDEPQQSNSTQANAPLDISREKLELIQYRVDETTTFGILTILLLILSSVTIFFLPSVEVVSVLIALVLLIFSFFMYKCILLAVANPNTSAPMLLFCSVFLPLFGLMLAANTYFNSRSLVVTLSENAPATS